MKWCVYWQCTNEEIECEFFKTEAEARARVDALILECENTWTEGFTSNWDITLMEVKGEVHQHALGDGSLKLFSR